MANITYKGIAELDQAAALTSDDLMVVSQSGTAKKMQAIMFKGDTGNGISSVAKTATSGLVDTYTVTFTDGTTTTFTVTNGAKGDKGDTGAKGDKGDTGNGIASITKTSTSGLVDTYTVSMTDGTNTTFTVTNGEDGAVTAEEEAEINRRILASFPTATLTDQQIATFDDGADDIPVKDLAVSIEPIQSGSGDPTPDNVRPITGWTGARIARTGKNLFKSPTGEPITSSGVTLTPNSDGSFTLEGEASANASNFNVNLPTRLPTGTKVTISLNNADINSAIAVRLVGISRSGGALYSTPCYASTENATLTYTIIPNMVSANRINIICGTSAGGHDAVAPITLKVQVELGDTATAWQPYSGTTYPVSWASEAGTVYGGTLDVTTGLLTVTRAMVDAGTLAWGKNTALTNAFSGALAPQGNMVATNPFAIICSKYKTAENISSVGQLPDLCITGSINDSNTFRYIFIRDDFFAPVWENNTPEVFKAALDGAQVSFLLTTPQTYQLTPTEVKTLLGENHIWADTGNTSVTYRADPTLYIDGKVAALTALMSES